MTTYLRTQLARARREICGETLIEYTLLAFLVAVASIVLLTAIGVDINEVFDVIENALGTGNPDVAPPTGDDDTAVSGIN